MKTKKRNAKKKDTKPKKMTKDQIIQKIKLLNKKVESYNRGCEFAYEGILIEFKNIVHEKFLEFQNSITAHSRGVQNVYDKFQELERKVAELDNQISDFICKQNDQSKLDQSE